MNLEELYRALIKACEEGDIKTVVQLLSIRVVNVNIEMHDKFPLKSACEKNHIELVKILLNEKNIDVNKQVKNGDTALSSACNRGNVEIVKLLIDKGVKFKGSFNLWNATLQLTVKSGSKLEDDPTTTNKYFECIKILSNNFPQVEEIVEKFNQDPQMKEAYNKCISYCQASSKKSARSTVDESDFGKSMEGEFKDLPCEEDLTQEDDLLLSGHHAEDC